MRYLSSFKQLHLYRNKEFLMDAPNPKKPRINTQITVLSKSRDDMVRILNERTFNLRYVKSVFTEKMTRLKLLIGGMKTVRQDVNDVYKDIAKRLPNIAFYFINPRQYMNRNLIYDASIKLSMLDHPMVNTPIKFIKQAYATLDLIHNDNRFSEYIKKYYIVEIDTYMKPVAAYYMRQNIKTIPQVIMYRLMNDPETMVDYVGSTFIFINQTGMFTYITLTSDMIIPDSKENHRVTSKLQLWYKRLYAFNVGDIDEIAECAGEIEEETEEEIQKANSKSIIEEKLSKISQKLIKNNSSASNGIKSALISALDNRELDSSDEMNNYVETSDVIEEPDSSETLKDILDKNKRIIDDEELTDLTENLEDDSDIKKIETDLEKIDKIGNILDSEGYPSEDDEKEAKTLIKTLKKAQISSHTETELKKIKSLEENFGKIKMTDDSGTFEDLLKEFEKIQFETSKLPAKDVVNKSLTNATGQDFTKQYNKKMLDATIVSVMKQLEKNETIKMICTDATKEDISDNTNAMYRYTFKLEDEYGKKHVIKYNIPKLVNNKFFFINGNKKMLNTQITFIPVVKIKPDTVTISTWHNIMELTRFSRAFDPKVESMIKFLKDKIPGNGAYGITIKLGDSTVANSEYNTSMEYDGYSAHFYSIVIENEKTRKSISFMFNQQDIIRMIENLGITYSEKSGMFPVAVTDDKRVIYIDSNSGKSVKDKDITISDMIYNSIVELSSLEDPEKELNRITIPKKYMYSRLYYINYKISFGVFLGFLFGISELLKSMGVKYEFLTDKKQYSNTQSQRSQNMIQFKDGYLYYDINPLRHSLLLNGIAAEMDCSQYKFSELDDRIPFLNTFDELFKTKQPAKGYISCKEFMMDPTSVEVMKYLNLPTEFLPVMLYANSLLEDNSKSDPKQLEINRFRKLELIPVLMYKSIRDAFDNYRNRSNRKHISMTVKENDVLNRLLESGLLNDYDTLNPVRELETEGTLTWKGPGGCSVDDAYSLSRRAYDQSMIGTISSSSPDSSSVGITRYMSMNPRISNLLGFVKSGNDDDVKDVDFGNIGSIAELTTPFAIDHDDPKRLGFVTKESKHLMPAYNTDPLLIGNGVEKVFPYMTSSDFISSAKNDGVVSHVDKDLGIAIVEYKDGSKESIDIKNREHRDGGNSMYIEAKKDFPFNVGDKFKKNDILARNPAYFSVDNGNSSPEYNPGVLSNVAIIMSFATFEDSSLITERIADKLSANVIIPETIVLGAKANISGYLKVGDTFQTGDPLIVYEDELSDEEASTVLSSNMNPNDFQSLDEIVRQAPHAQCSGVIHNIKVFYTVPYEDMSESVRKLCKEHDEPIKKRQSLISKYGASMPDEIIVDHVGITTPRNDKINGRRCPVGKVLIEIYQKYTDYPGSGDKIVFYASMKTTIHRQIPQELAPYPVGHPERPIDALLSPISVNARMVTSILYALYGNKLVWALKEKLKKIYSKYADEELKTVKVESHDLPNKGVSIESTINALEEMMRNEVLSGDLDIDDLEKIE